MSTRQTSHANDFVNAKRHAREKLASDQAPQWGKRLKGDEKGKEKPLHAGCYDRCAIAMTFYLSKRSDRDLVKSNHSSQYQSYDPGVTITISHGRSGVVFYIARFSEVASAVSDCHDLHG